MRPAENCRHHPLALGLAGGEVPAPGEAGDGEAAGRAQLPLQLLGQPLLQGEGTVQDSRERGEDLLGRVAG